MRFSASITFMFTEHPFLDRFAAAKAAGFGGVEIQVLETDARAAAAAARAADIDVALLNAPMGDLIEGGPGLSGVPGRECEFREGITSAIESAKILNVRHVHVGPSRVPKGESVEKCLASLVSNLGFALDLANAADVTLLIEPMNKIDMPDSLIVDTDQAIAFLKEHFDGQIWLQFDLYHVAQSGHDIVTLFQRHADVIKHIQFADTPGRGAPGTGGIDFEGTFAAIKTNGYVGWAGAEYYPNGPTPSTLEWMSKFS